MTAETLMKVPPTFSATADWVRGLQRTAPVTWTSERTLSAIIQEKAETLSTHPALLGEGDALSFAELSARANKYARWGIGLGLTKGDRVAIMMANQPDYAAIWIGLGRIGVVAALLNTQLVGDGLAHVLAVSEAKHLIVEKDFVGSFDGIQFSGRRWVHEADLSGAISALPDAPLRSEELPYKISLQDEALLIYTSGTTGLPKAARVSHYRIMMWSEWFAGILGATPEDRLYNCLPMYHSIGGVVAVGAMLVAGGTVIVRGGFSAGRFWDDVAASGATIFQYIGELCRYLLASRAEDGPIPHGLRLCVGNGLRKEVWDEFAQRFSIPRIIEFYASTEGSFSLFNLEGRPGAIGRIPRFIAHRSPVALVDFDHATEMPVRDADGFCRRCRPGYVGEALGMVARENNGLSMRFEGYTSETETQRKILRNVFEPGDSWYRTGDLMRQDTAGFFYFVDRIGDTFRWKGENIATSEVADAIAACDGVIDAAVFGVTVPNTDGRAGMAALVTAAGFDLARFREQVAERLPRPARPIFLRIRDRMAVTGTFKLQKHELVREGFDPSAVTEKLYVDDASTGAYVDIDLARFAAIAAGEMRL